MNDGILRWGFGLNTLISPEHNGPVFTLHTGRQRGEGSGQPTQRSAEWGVGAPCEAGESLTCPRGRVPHGPTTDGGPDAGDSGRPVPGDP